MRYSSIDLLRTLAIIIMVMVHFIENLAGQVPLIAGIGAPLFMFLSGVSYRLWLNSQLAKHRDSNEISQVTVRRGLFLIGLGFVFNILVWMPEDTFNWDVLTLIGCSTLVLDWARRMPLSIVLVLCASIYAISPAARQAADWSSYWSNGHYDPDLTLSDVVQGFLVVGYFPILPWLIVPLFGFVIGTDFFGAGPSHPPSVAALRRGQLGGGMLIALAALILTVRYYWPSTILNAEVKTWTMFPASPVYLLGVLGWAWCSFAVAYDWLDRRSSQQTFTRLRAVTSTMSKHSLSAYIGHHLLHIWPLWIWGAWTTNEMTSLWQAAMPTYLAVSLAVVCLALLYIIFRWTEQYRWPTMESWMRWLCD